MSPAKRRPRTKPPTPLAELHPDHQAAIRNADPALGELTAPAATLTALRDLGLAFQLPGNEATFLSLDGWDARTHLRAPYGPRQQRAAGTDPFMAADGHGTLPDRDAHRTTAERAWPYTLEGRRLAGAMTTPAPLEQQYAVQAVSLALEASGMPPAEHVPRKPNKHGGYLTTQGPTQHSVCLTWKTRTSPDKPTPPTEPATTPDEGLARCGNALLARGWENLRYLDSSRQPYLLIWPRGERAPLPT